MTVSSEPGRDRGSLNRPSRAAEQHPALWVAVACGLVTIVNVALVALPSGWDVAAAVGLAAVVLAVGRRWGLSWQQMGLGRESVSSGVRWGALAVVAVAVFYAIVVALPATRETSDDLATPPGDSVWVTALLLIPLRTVILEELSFRGVLWGLLERRFGTWWALGGTALAFGCWHVAPALSLADRTGGAVALSVLGVLVFTSLAGLVLGELRRRSGSVIAPAALHWAANGVGLVAAHLV